VACGTHTCFCPEFVPEDGGEHKDWCAAKKVINGSAVHVTATFGMFLAGLVIQDVTAAHPAPAQAGCERD
jgi:tRNA A37 threonylcarbamoyladenosine dehydratase